MNRPVEPDRSPPLSSIVAAVATAVSLGIIMTTQGMAIVRSPHDATPIVIAVFGVVMILGALHAAWNLGGLHAARRETRDPDSGSGKNSPKGGGPDGGGRRSDSAVGFRPDGGSARGEPEEAVPA